MKKNLLSIILILFVPIFAYMFISNSNTTTAQQTNTTDKAQIVKFTSTMCLDCQKMNKIIKEIYPKYQDKITLTEIQVQDGKSFTKEEIEKYNVTLVPTIILIDSRGKQTKRIEGAISKNEMERCLKGLK